ncbi:MAG: hypothetical protein R3E48_14130 [Burkholderiaceae bacterium]
MSVENVSDAPQGFDTAAVERWIGANLSSLVPPLSWERLLADIPTSPTGSPTPRGGWR